MTWVVYIVECADLTLYTGITNNLEKRLDDHVQGRGAKYTKGRSPLKLVYQEECVDRSDASKRELKIKKLTRSAKNALIQNYS